MPQFFICDVFFPFGFIYSATWEFDKESANRPCPKLLTFYSWIQLETTEEGQREVESKR